MEKGMKNEAMTAVLLTGLLFLCLCLSGCVSPQRVQDQQDAQWHYEMAAGYFEAGEIALAIKELMTSLERNPDLHEAHHLLGFIYMGRRDYNKATHHISESIRLKPDYHIARNNLGSLFLALERWEDAQEQFEMLIDEPLYPTPELAHNNLGWAYYNQRRYSRAIEHYRMAIFLRPQMCLAFNNLGLAYMAIGNFYESSENFREAIERCPTNFAEPHFHLGKLLIDNGDAQNAMGHFRRCVEIDSSSNVGRRCREYLHFQ